MLDCLPVTMPANNKNIVLISGGASGIGRRIAERFLEQGDSVHVCDVSAGLVEEFLAANPGASGTVADIGSRDSSTTPGSPGRRRRSTRMTTTAGTTVSASTCQGRFT